MPPEKAKVKLVHVGGNSPLFASGRTLGGTPSSEALKTPRQTVADLGRLRDMGEFLVESGHLTENPVKQLKMRRKDAAVRHTPSDADVIAFFEVASASALPAILSFITGRFPFWLTEDCAARQTLL